MFKWVEISNEPDRARFTALSRILNESGFENEVDFIEANSDTFAELARDARSRFDFIRIGGPLCEEVGALFEHYPSSLLTLKVSDALVMDVNTKQWWPRNLLVPGLTRAVVTDVSELDMDGAVFILGVGCETRVAIEAFARLGFSRFSIADVDDAKCKALIEDVRTKHFGVQFQYVAREQITQLPSVHSVAVNTLGFGRDDGTHGELFYFNFLKPGGVWLDMALHRVNIDLEAEAKAVGAQVLPGLSIAVWTDVECAASTMGARLDHQKLSAAYAEAFSKSQA